MNLKPSISAPVTAIIAMAVTACSSFVRAEGELHFPKKEQPVRVPADKDAISVAFPFSNKSDHPVRLGRIKPDCDCTTAVYENDKKTLQPGESCTVIATMKTGTFTGKVTKGITIEAEGSSYGVSILADIPEIIRINPRQLAWKQGAEAKPQAITITLDPSCPIKLKEVSLSGKGFDFEPVTITPGKVYRVIITPKSTEKPTFESVWILTDSKLARYSKTVSFVSVNPAK